MRKIMLLSINWETLEAKTVFFTGPDAMKTAETALDLMEATPFFKGWRHTIMFGKDEQDIRDMKIKEVLLPGVINMEAVKKLDLYSGDQCVCNENANACPLHSWRGDA